MHHLAAHLAWPKVKRLAERGVWALVPVGSTEAHGPHLPLNVDVVIAQEVCRRLGRHLEVVEFPAIAYALTDFAAPFPGTVTLPEDTAKALLVGVLTGLVRSGFSRVAVINHHLEPAHFRLVHAAAAEAQAAGNARIVAPDHRRRPTGPLLGEEFMHGGSHAGCYETSLMLAAAPALVDDTLRRALTKVAVDLPGAIKAGASTFLDAGGPEAYFGDPASASAAEGERLFDLIVESTLAALT